MTHRIIRRIALHLRVLTIVGIACALGTGGHAGAEEVTLPVYVASSGANRPTLGIPRWKGYMHESNSNIFWISYASQSSSGSELSYTLDAGQSWSTEPIQISNNGYMDFHLSLFGYNGELYFTFPGVDFRKFSSPAQGEEDRGPLVELVGTAPSFRSNIMVDGNGRIWIFTRDGDNSSENVRFQYSDNNGSSWTRGVAAATGSPNVRIGSMPYVGGRPALVVLHLDDPRGYEYFLWNGSQFEARPDHSIHAQDVGYSRSFSHNVVADTVMHVFFGNGNDLHHVWKNYNNGSGEWNRDVVETSPYTSDMDWSPASTVRGNDLYLFYSKKMSSSDASSQIFYKKWSQLTHSWTAPVQISGGLSNAYNFDPNTSFRVPLSSPYIPVFWHSGTSDHDIYFAKIVLDSAAHDVTPPTTVSNLTAAPGSTHGTYRLQWTAPGDDGMTGKASQYVIKYSAQPITAGNWNSAVTYPNPPVPLVAGQTQSLTISGLTAGGTYYAAIRAFDDAGNQSGVSNSPSGFAAGIRVPGVVGSAVDTILLRLTATANQVSSYYTVEYQFALDTTSAFSQPALKIGQKSGSTASVVFSQLVNGRSYFWRVRARAVGGADSSAWTAPVQVSVGSCCDGTAGNVDYDASQYVDLSDMVFLANHLFLGGPVPPCRAEANVDGDNNGHVDLSDLIYLANYLFVNGPLPAACE